MWPQMQKRGPSTLYSLCLGAARLFFSNAQRVVGPLAQ